ncbi:MAG: mucoidy inhibitor MuiA family protein [Alphaproteobacteria bacterium]|nr:mucoidy inhibitor MuiA family protein [Alphaproteobacteria bacterium]
MYRILSLFICLSVFLPHTAFAKNIDASSTLTEATVYTNRAKLTRVAKISLPKGEHKIIISGLSSRIFTDSLRAKGTAFGKVTLGAVTYKSVTQAELIKPREKALNDQLVTLQDKKKLVNAEKSALKIQKIFLENIGKNIVQKENENIARLDLDPESWKTASSMMHTQIIDNLKQSLILDQNMRDLTKQEAQIRAELSKLRTGQRSTLEVSIPVEATSATTLTLDLDYQIPNASWTPLYDARLSTKDETLDLILYGSVQQNTGEDWTDIKLTLSTAQPHRGTGQPDLGPKWVYLASPNIAMHAARGRISEMKSNTFGGAMPMASSEMDSLMETDFAREESVVEIKQAQINTEGFVSEYIIPGPSSVLADGSKSKLLIGTFKTETSLYTEIKPQLSNQAYLVSQSTLLGDAPILPGRINLFRDDAYVGQSYTPLLRPGEKKNLAFGIDDNVSVTRRALKDEKSEEGIVNIDKVLERHFLTEIVNLHKEPVKIVVLQNTPVSQNEDIEVTILKTVTTQGYKNDFDKIKGLMRWNTTLAPKEQKDIKLGWRVIWPKDKTISGL